jgi:hypothetical protein
LQGALDVVVEPEQRALITIARHIRLLERDSKWNISRTRVLTV